MVEKRVKSKSWVARGTGEIFLNDTGMGVHRRVAVHIKTKTPIDAYKAMELANKSTPINYSTSKYQKVGNFKITSVHKGYMPGNVKVYRRKSKK